MPGMGTTSFQTLKRILNENSVRLSRTRKGVSDTSTSEFKQPLRLTGDLLKQRSAENEAKAHEFIWSCRARPTPTSADDVRRLLFELADIINDGLLPAGRLRAWPIAGKLPPRDLEHGVDDFCRVICGRWNEPAADPVPLAAWAEWELNGGSLHPFYDGCGRIARTFAALLLLQANSDLPLYDNLASYFQHGGEGTDSFIAYMRDSIARGREWLATQTAATAEFRLACYGLIHNAEGHALLIQRPANKHFPNQWEFPGGKLDPAETPGQAVQREAREETGLAVMPLSLAGAVEHEIKGLRVIMLVLECRLDGGEVQLSDEHQAFRWTPREEITRMDLTPQLRRFFESHQP